MNWQTQAIWPLLLAGCYAGVSVDTPMDGADGGTGFDEAGPTVDDGANENGEDGLPGVSSDTEGAETEGGDTTSPTGPGTPPELPTDCRDVGSMPQSLVTRDELSYVIADIFSPLPIELGDSLLEMPLDAPTPELSLMTETHVSGLLRIAETTADQVVENFDQLGLDCAGDRGCAEAFVSKYGRRAFRGELSDDAAEELVTRLFDPQPSFEAGIHQLVQGLLMRAETLYRYEGAFDDGLLTPLAKAAKLSFMVWGSIPDDELLDAAVEDRLNEPEQLRAQLTRMLEDPRFRRSQASFFRSMLHIKSSRDAAKVQELERTAAHVFANGGTFADLMTTTQAVVNEELAEFYGVAFPADTAVDGWGLVELGPQRPGLLTRAAFLDDSSDGDIETSPTIRGLVVLEEVECFEVPPPPPEVVDEFPQVPRVDGMTTRQELEQMVEGATTCIGCHDLMDPVGFVFENFDATGQWRDEQEGQPIDTVVDTGLFGPLSGYADLVNHLSSSDRAMDCFAKHWFEQTFLRAPNEADECSMTHVSERFLDGDGELVSLFDGLVESPSFHWRAD